MSNLKSVNFYDLCRVCTATTDQKIDIFSAEGRTKNLTAKLMECLSLNVDEFDRLPKVLCQQCQKNLDTFIEFRNICRNSQNMLSSCLASAQNGGKVLIKDMLSSSGKSLSVLNNVVSNSSITLQQPQSLIQPPPPLTTQTQQPSQIQQHPVFSLQGSNLVAQAITSSGSVQNQDFLNSIMQAVGIQTESVVKTEKPSLPQYTITVDNSIQQPPQQQQQQQQLQQQTNQSPDASVKDKDLKTNALEEFLKMKPNIKITPIGKKNQQQQQQAQQDQLLQQQQQEQQQQQQQHQHQLVQLQLQQLQQQVQQQLHQQQLQQQLQLLTSQLQPQQITITAPTLQPHQQPPQQQLTQGTPSTLSTDNTTTSHSDTEDSSPSKNKKPKLNFVLTPPHNNATISATIPQLTTTVNPHTSLGPQIQLQLHPTLTHQAMLQQNHHNPNTTAALLSNLAPLLQPQTQLNAALQSQLASVTQNSSTNLLSPNKCFLPITIKDENTDQQFVAHIDAKNFLLPTTYQLQMKLQPQIATADGQPIMQLAPTSIPATLQLTPQALGANQTFQAAANVASFNTNQGALNNNQPLPAQTIQQTQPSVVPQSTQMKQPMTPKSTQPQVTPTQQITHQSTHQSYKQIPSNISKTVQITSQQIINPGNVKQEPQPVTTQEADKPKSQTSGTAVVDNVKVLSRQKYKISQQPGSSAIEITPTTSFTQQIMQQVQQQQQQKLQQQTSPTTTTVTTQHGSITAHITTKTNQNPATANGTTSSETITHSTRPANSNVSQTILPTLPILNKNNITISRVTRQNQPNNNKQTTQSNQTMKVASSIPATTTLKVVAQQQKNRQSVSTPIPTAKTPQHQVQSFPTATVQQNQLPTQKPQVVSNIPNTTLRISPTKKVVAQIQKPVSEIVASDQNSNSITSSLPVTASTQRTAPPSRPSIEADPVVDSSISASTGQTGNNIECSQCGRVFKKKEHLTQHLKLHTGIRPFKCNEEGCPKAFHRKEHLLRHLVSHSGKKMFNCDICQKPFSRKDNLSKHRKIHNDTSTSNYVCDICNKSFAVKAYYTQHKLLHKTKGLPPEEDIKTEETNSSNQNKSSNNDQQDQSEYQNEQQQAQMLTQSTMISQQHEQQHQNPTLHLVHQQLQQLQQQPGQPQIMHLQLPTSMVTTQDLAGNTITITQASNNPNANTLKGHDATVLNLPTSLANFVQLSQAQFVNAATGQIMGHLKIEK